MIHGLQYRKPNTPRISPCDTRCHLSILLLLLVLFYGFSQSAVAQTWSQQASNYDGALANVYFVVVILSRQPRTNFKTKATQGLVLRETTRTRYHRLPCINSLLCSICY